MLGLAVCLGATASFAAAVLGVGLVRRRLAVVEVAGRSMEPVLSSGDRVLVRRARLNELRPGLVVVVEMPRLDTDDPELPPGWPPGHREWVIERYTTEPRLCLRCDRPNSRNGWGGSDALYGLR